MASFLFTVLTVLTYLILIDVILSWIMPSDRFPRNLTAQITEPLYAPIRALLKPERMGGFDLSPMLVLFLLYALKDLLRRVTP